MWGCELQSSRGFVSTPGFIFSRVKGSSTNDRFEKSFVCVTYYLSGYFALRSLALHMRDMSRLCKNCHPTLPPLFSMWTRHRSRMEAPVPPFRLQEAPRACLRQ